ncbi:hypothetical protein BLNAU_7671 [Blattamonas nauphoetae]|uniref:B30.2/SPRY domain-containing protein n=1 Tax=Blattamonas nauphoetae TaxID=2049346 RepID=A0ABQ9Y0Q1_9EUKA|nr:hypothetical protein BLNAU_7671 [Blattamonas nauphoetae]
MFNLTFTILSSPSGTLSFGLMDSSYRIPVIGEELGVHVKYSVCLDRFGYLDHNTPSETSGRYYHSHLKEGDCVRMEVDLVSTPRTLQFFVNGEAGECYVSGIPSSVRIGVSLFGTGTSFRIDNISRLSRPTPISEGMNKFKCLSLWELSLLFLRHHLESQQAFISFGLFIGLLFQLFACRFAIIYTLELDLENDKFVMDVGGNCCSTACSNVRQRDELPFEDLFGLFVAGWKTMVTPKIRCDACDATGTTTRFPTSQNGKRNIFNQMQESLELRAASDRADRSVEDPDATEADISSGLEMLTTKLARHPKHEEEHFTQQELTTIE